MSDLDEQYSSGDPFSPTSVAVVGAGLTGALSALVLKVWQPSLSVTLYGAETPRELGQEVATPSVLALLHGYLGVDPHPFFREVLPTWTLGTRLAWGQPGAAPTALSFEEGDVRAARAFSADPADYSLSAMLMAAARAPVAALGDSLYSLLPKTRVGYAWRPKAVTKALLAQASSLGLLRKDDPIREVLTDSGQVAGLRLADGSLAVHDLYIDCSGDPALLIGETLGVPYESFAESLPCSAALVGRRTRKGGAAPFRAIGTLDAGFAWDIPVLSHDRVGYAFSPGFTKHSDAEAELRGAIADLGPLELWRFEPGRRRDFIHRNVVAVGESYGTLEPLHPVALHLACAHLTRLLTTLAAGGRDVGRANAQIRGHWDYLRWFYALHYRFNGLRDTPFWRHARADVDISGLRGAVEDYRSGRFFSDRPQPPRFVADAIFGAQALDRVLLMQGITPTKIGPGVTREEWHQLSAMRRTLVGHALTVEAAGRRALADRTLLDGMVLQPDGWCVADSDDVHELAPAQGPSPAGVRAWAKANKVPITWPTSYGEGPDEHPLSPCIDFGKFLRKVPHFVLKPKNQEQLTLCVTMLAARRIRFKVRATAHCSGGQTLIDDGAVIDVQWLRRIVDDRPQDGTIRVEAGIWWTEVCDHLAGQGRRPPVLTANLRTSVFGALATGGFGGSTHSRGLLLDHVQELTIITLDGQRHRVRPGDLLFDYSMAGLGQLGVVAEVVLATRPTHETLVARVVTWDTLQSCLDDMVTIATSERFDTVGIRYYWKEGKVRGALGNYTGDGTASQARLIEGLAVDPGKLETLDFDAFAGGPNEHWLPASPSIECVMAVDQAATFAARAGELLIAAGVTDFIPIGTAIQLCPGPSRFPLAPIPDAPHTLVFAIRPEVPLEHVERLLPTLRDVGRLALDLGGKIYIMSIPLDDDDFLERQYGAALDTFRALKREHDPHGLLNPGFITP